MSHLGTQLAGECVDMQKIHSRRSIKKMRACREKLNLNQYKYGTPRVVCVSSRWRTERLFFACFYIDQLSFSHST